VLDLKPNVFHQTMLDFAHGHSNVDLFSQACIEQYDHRPTDHYGYLFAQVFEPHVLAEIAALEGISRARLEQLEAGLGARIDSLRADIVRAAAMTPVEAVNVAAALISISRFGLAAHLLDTIDPATCDERDIFEIEMLRFVIANRLSDVRSAQRAFREMRRIAETARLPAERVIDAAGQAVVWHMKSRMIDRATFDWFLGFGNRLIADGDVEAGAKSSWYRAIAMIPASRGDGDRTRALMLRARSAGEESLRARPRAYELHLLKTYHESALKEYLYLTGDRDAALAEAHSLITLDPHWSPSHGEEAEIHLRFGDWEAAATCFERAGRMGPPFVGHHLFCAAQAWERAQAKQRALAIYADLLDLDDRNLSVVVAGVRLERRLGKSGEQIFEAAFEAVKASLGREHREYLQN